MKKITWIVLLIVTMGLSSYLLYYGIKAGDNNEIGMNASLICFSCIGLE